MSDADRLVELVLDLERFQVVVDVRVEIDQPTIDQLHDRNPGHHLADRADPEDGAVGDDRARGVHLGAAPALDVDGLTAMDHGDRGPGDVVILHLVHEHRVEGIVQRLPAPGRAGTGVRRREPDTDGNRERRERQRQHRDPASRRCFSCRGQ